MPPIPSVRLLSILSSNFPRTTTTTSRSKMVSLSTSPSPSPSSFAIIAGVGPGTGASIARKFAASYPVVLLARNRANFDPIASEINRSGGKAVGISADATDPTSMRDAFRQIAELDGVFQGSRCAAAVYNVGGRFVRKPFLELELDEFESGWESNG